MRLNTLRLLPAALLACSTGASAGAILGPSDPAPAHGDYIRLMPGQRERLSFDAAQLYNETFLASLLEQHATSRAPLHENAKRAGEFVCNGAGPWATQAGVGRCAGLLIGLGNATCGTHPGEPPVMCDVKEQGVRTVVRGLTLSGANQASRCIDAANGVEWVARNCGRQERCVKQVDGNGTTSMVCYTGGVGAASGNGNFLMYLYGDSYAV
jgi:hypothetical protein